jgi:hypothetical protein
MGRHSKSSIPHQTPMALVFLCLMGVGWITSAFANGATAENRSTVLVVVGAAGEEEFGRDFEKCAQELEKASARAGARHLVIGLGSTNDATDLSLLKKAIASEPTNSPTELWIVLVGHGTFDGKEAKFNLRGPDVSATELSDWLKPFRRPVAIINCTSSSSPFMNKLSSPNRVVVTATRSGYEQNFARFGQHFAESIASTSSDLDKDGQTSLLEAFLMASRKTLEFYETEGRLATEHALIDDNGDGQGTPADWFRGIRATKKPAQGSTIDGLRAHQFHLIRSDLEQRMSPHVRVRRDELEVAVSKLRDSKATLPEDEYYRRLENLMLQLASLYAEAGTNAPPASIP